MTKPNKSDICSGAWENRITRSGTADPKELRKNPDNWRTHPKNQAAALEGVLNEIGWIQDVIVNERTGNMIDGHLRVELAVKHKEPTIPVKYVDLSEEEEKKAILTFDPIGAMAEADKALLDGLMKQVSSDSEAVSEMLDALAKEVGIPCRDANEVADDNYEPPAEIETSIQRGDLFRLGRHRLLCGDATSADDVARLMGGVKADICFTSPPYNAGSLNIKGQVATGAKYLETSDDLNEDEYVGFLNSTISNALIAADDAMINIGLVEGNKRAIIRILNLYIDNFKDIIYWKKSTCAPHIQPGVINNQIEFILCFGDGKRRFKSAQFRQGTYWNVIEGPHASNNEYAKIHKATFPVYLPANIIENFCPPGGRVFEPFLGTGTTLVACEQLGRTCYGMEISPQYCQVIIDRWEKLTGQKAEKVDA